MTSKEVRQKFLDFFKKREHSIISSASLIPENDSSLLFTNSGMSPLIPYLLGEKHPQGRRLVNSQRCFRAEDIEKVGDSYHTTFFEMLGNWSLGDYFKKEQLNYWFEFLIEELGLNPKRLYQTVYVGDAKIVKDQESIQILKEIYLKYGIKALEGPETKTDGTLGPGIEIDFNRYRIFAYKRDKNWWQRGDVIGELGGPDSETFYDTGKKHNLKFGRYCHLNCECGRFIEIGNSVFMQYQKTKDGWQHLKEKNVDFGAGLERITMIVQKKNNIFEIDLFENIIKKIQELSGIKYQENYSSFEIIADHLKAAVFIMGDNRGVSPSNVEQGYIVRRLIRKAIRHAKQIGIEKKMWIKEIAEIIVQDYLEIYPELKQNFDFIINNLKEEEDKFSKTMERGLKELEKYIKEEKEITGALAFDIYQTYGFPLEMIEEELVKKERKIIDKQEFQQALKRHQKLSRTTAIGKFKGGLADVSEQTKKFHTATHLLLSALRKILSEDVRQKGSNITAERLRFDFSHSEKLNEEQKQEIEKLVNQIIKKDLPIICEEMSLNEAKKQGALGVFEQRYGEKVKVYTIGKGQDLFSKEICAGPHVKHTGELGNFKIIKEESSGAGIRRIKAVLE